MDSLLLLLKGIVSIVVILVLISSTYHLWNWKGRRDAPQPGRRFPIIGHLHLVGAKEEPPVRTFAAMADKHGPVFTFWMGMRRAIVVSSRAAARECFTVNDKALSSRPRFAAAEHLAYNYAMFASAPYGSYWREIRKIATLEVLSNRRLELQKHVSVTEVDASIKSLYTRWIKNWKLPVKVEMREWFGDLTFNNVVMMIAGKRYFGGGDVEEDKEGREFRRCILEFFYLMGVFVASDAVPFVKWLDLQGHVKAMKKAAADMDVVLSKWLEEHRQKRSSGGEDFIHVLLSILEDAKIASTYDPDTIIKSTSLALILGGTDTTTVTLTWALALLINNPRVLKKLREEIDTRVGKERNVSYVDISNLPYLHATIKEVMRLYPAAPLSSPREAIEDCEVAGFRVPAGTRVMFNLWKIQRDPEIWDEPEEFRPERFLSGHNYKDFEYIPFGSGRRVCPGNSFALQVMHLVLARLLHAFDFETPSGHDLPVDMTEGLGLTMPKANPLEVMFTPRLPSSLYS